MTALGKLVRTTAFKLMAAYLAVFSLFSAGLLGYFAWNTQRLIGLQTSDAIDTEIDLLSNQYNIGGIRRLANVVDRRSRRPDSLLYLVTNFRGEALAGNISELPSDVLKKEGLYETAYTRFDETADSDPQAMVRVFVLDGGFRLLVGRDLAERSRMRAIMTNGAIGAGGLVLVLGVAGGWFVARRVLSRLDDISATSRSIIEGDLTRRIAITGTHDEIDRLASTTNTMLDRIGELMSGLKQVSDNIAHDLKTPLTRLRNRAEEALRVAKTDEDYRVALEQTIEDSDGLIKVFNALLMIARAEAGQLTATMEPFDVAALARGMAELYEPAAEEAGMTFAVEAPFATTLKGSRELVGQAIANLIDNALKYGAGEIRVRVATQGEQVQISVTDKGAGIPAEDHARVTERFVRLDTSRSQPGFGLGLSLVAAVAKLHGGAITLGDNKPGLAVTLILPSGLAG